MAFGRELRDLGTDARVLGGSRGKRDHATAASDRDVYVIVSDEAAEIVFTLDGFQLSGA